MRNENNVKTRNGNDDAPDEWFDEMKYRESALCQFELEPIDAKSITDGQNGWHRVGRNVGRIGATFNEIGRRMCVADDRFDISMLVGCAHLLKVYSDHVKLLLDAHVRTALECCPVGSVFDITGY